MTEAEWISCADPEPMLKFLRGKASERKLRLFAVACCRRLLREVRVEPQDVQAVDVAERYADGEATDAELAGARRYIPGPPSARRTTAFACRDAASREPSPEVAADGSAGNAAWAAGEHAAFLADAAVDSLAFTGARQAEMAAQARLLRDILGPSPFRPVPPPAPAWLVWNDGAVRKLAEAIYEERAFERMPALADALEDAGCADPVLLGHLRGSGPHARGCFVVDGLLGKS